MAWILNHIDCFVSRSRTAKAILMRLFSVRILCEDIWDKIGRQSSKALRARYLYSHIDDVYDDGHQLGILAHLESCAREDNADVAIVSAWDAGSSLNCSLGRFMDIPPLRYTATHRSFDTVYSAWQRYQLWN
jgi:hypothetical protein